MHNYVNPDSLVKWPITSYAVGGRGELYHLSGHVAEDENGQVVGAGDIVVQSAQIWKNLRATIEAIGAEMTDVVKMTIYLTDPRFRPAMTEEREKHFPKGFEPAGTLAVVSGLANPDFLAEVELVVIVPDER